MLLDIIISQVINHAHWTYIYTDGNNNRWYISPQKLEYRPVFAPESGSGIYSGGKPFTITLKPSQYQELIALFKVANSSRVHQRDSREKGDSALTIFPDRADERVIFLKRESEPQRQISLWLEKSKPSP